MSELVEAVSGKGERRPLRGSHRVARVGVRAKRNAVTGGAGQFLGRRGSWPGGQHGFDAAFGPYRCGSLMVPEGSKEQPHTFARLPPAIPATQ
jgi:hypothetical protein